MQASNSRGKMPSTVIDLLSQSSDDEKEIGEVEVKEAGKKQNGGKRKIEDSRKEPHRKNPCPRNSSATTPRDESKSSPVRRVSPGLEEQRVVADDEDDEVIVLEQPAKFASSAVAVVTKAPRIWWDSDSAIITYDVITPLRRLQGGNLLLANATSLPHIQQTDKWSCGFRNIQMLLSALVPLLPATHPYFLSLAHIYLQEVPAHMLIGDAPLLILPSLTQLQQQLEASWREGFDPKGADHFKHSVVGRPSRIGAVEVGFVLSFWWIDAYVVQFIKCFQSRRLLPPFIYRYFQGRSQQGAREKAMECLQWAEAGNTAIAEASANRDTDHDTILPMYLQWEGHSVTVIGIEPPTSGSNQTNWNQWNLLVFCPIRSGKRLKSSDATQPFRVPCSELMVKDCQLVLSGREPLTPAMRMQRKDSAPAVTAAKEAVCEVVAWGG